MLKYIDILTVFILLCAFQAALDDPTQDILIHDFPYDPRRTAANICLGSSDIDTGIITA